MSTVATCARCERQLNVGDRVVDVRIVSRIYPIRDTLATDRDDTVAHLTCPEGE